MLSLLVRIQMTTNCVVISLIQVQGAGDQTDTRSSDDWPAITVTEDNFEYNATPEYIMRIMVKFPKVNNVVICQGDGLEVTCFPPRIVVCR